VIPLHPFDVHYLFNGTPREHHFDLPEEALLPHAAILHLLQLHFGDAENGLVMPAADATPADIIEQAATLGIELIANQSAQP
jgi:hypothetical protein